MAHRTSAAALNAARVILKAFNLEVRPKEELPSGQSPVPAADERCLSIVIDLSSNIFHVASLRPEMRYWQTRLHENTATAPQIATFMRRVIDAFNLLPKESNAEAKTIMTLETPPEFGAGKPEVYIISKASREAARAVFHYYKVTPKRKQVIIGEPSIQMMEVAKLVEVSTEISRAMPALQLMTYWSEQLKLGKATVSDIKKCFRKVGILLERLPNYLERECETKLL